MGMFDQFKDAVDKAKSMADELMTKAKGMAGETRGKTEDEADAADAGGGRSTAGRSGAMDFHAEDADDSTTRDAAEHARWYRSEAYDGDEHHIEPS